MEAVIPAPVRYDPCVFCGGRDLVLDCAISLLGKLDVDVTRCTACGLSFVNPALTPEQLGMIYDTSYWDPDPPGRGVLLAYRRYPRQYRSGAAYGRRLSRLAPRGRMLEIGCGLPFFLKGVADHCQWEVEGIDTAEGISRFAREKLGLRVREALFEASAFPEGSFDLVRAKDVLEHVSDPMAFLTGIRQVLRPGGRAELWLPDGPLDLAAARKHYRRGRRPAMGAGHVLFIPTRVLRAMLAKAGLRIERHQISGFRYALKALGLLRSRGDPPAGGSAARVGVEGPAPSLFTWEPPAPERGLKGTAAYAAFRLWRTHHPALPAIGGLALGFRHWVMVRKG